MDDMDHAQQLTELHVAKALASHRAATPTEPGADTCADCGDDIPEPRRKANPYATRCADCQAEHEA